MSAFNFADLASTTVNSAYTAGGTTLTPASKTGFPSSFPFDIRVAAEGSNTTELITVTGNSGAAWTVTGAQGSPVATTASNHAIGAVITAVLDVNGLTQIPTGGTDVSGALNNLVVSALVGGLVSLATVTAAMTWSAGTTPTLTQTQLPMGSDAAATAGTNFVVQAESGQPMTNRDGGNGGLLWLGGGNGGWTRDGGAVGAPGGVVLAVGDAGVLYVQSTGTVEPYAFGNATSLGTSTDFFNSLHTGQSVSWLDAGGTYYGEVAHQISACSTLGAGGFPMISMGAGGDAFTLGSSMGTLNLVNNGDVSLDIVDNQCTVIAEFSSYNTNGHIYFTPTVIQYQPSMNGNLTNNPNYVWSYPAQSSTSGGSGAVGGNVQRQAQPGQPATGASHNGGNGGSDICKMAAGGTSGSATAGTEGNCEVEDSAGNVTFSMGPQPHNVSVTAAIATDAGTTLTATQYDSERIFLGTVTASGNVWVTFPNATGLWEVDTSGITIGSYNLTFKSGTASVDAGTAALASGYTVWSRGSNTIFVHQ